jgi:MFS family permease
MMFTYDVFWMAKTIQSILCLLREVDRMPTAGLPAALERASADRIWTAEFVKVTAATTLVRICTQVQIVTMPLFFYHLGGSHTLAGLSMTFFTLAALLTRPFIGVALDAYGRKPIFLIGTAVYMISTFLYGFIAFIPALVLLRILHGVSFSASSTASSTIASDVLPERRMTEGLGYFGLFGTLAVAVAPTAALSLLETFGFSALYGATGAVALIALLLGIGIHSDRSRRRMAASAESADGRSDAGAPAAARPRWMMLEPRAIPPSVIVLFVSLSTSAVTVFLPTFAISRDIGGIGLFYTVQAASMVVSRLVIGRWSERSGPRAVVIVNLIALTGTLAGIGFSRSLWELLGWAVLFGFANGCLVPQLNAMAVTHADPANRGKANATFYIALDFGIGVGAAGWGLAIEALDMQWIFTLAAALPVVAMMTFGIRRRTRTGRER